MVLSEADQALVADMRQRERNIKQAQVAADIISHRLRRHRAVLLTLSAAITVSVVVAVFSVASGPLVLRPGWWPATIVVIVLSATCGTFLGQALLRTRWGRRILARREASLVDEFGGMLRLRRTWQPFYFQGEDISVYVPQILYFIEAGHDFDSVHAALTFIRSHPGDAGGFRSTALERFRSAAAATNLLVASSTDDSGRPSSRIMHFVRSDRLHVWFVTTAPQGPKVGEFDRGRIAITTLPSDSLATISSNRLQIRRLDASFETVADLYRVQAPGYVDPFTDEETQRELVYELTFESAVVDSWTDHDVIEFDL